jgi:hypothetical protein
MSLFFSSTQNSVPVYPLCPYKVAAAILIRADIAAVSILSAQIHNLFRWILIVWM